MLLIAPTTWPDAVLAFGMGCDMKEPHVFVLVDKLALGICRFVYLRVGVADAHVTRDQDADKCTSYMAKKLSSSYADGI